MKRESVSKSSGKVEAEGDVKKVLTPLAWRVEASASIRTWLDSSLFLSILIFRALISSKQQQHIQMKIQ